MDQVLLDLYNHYKYKDRENPNTISDRFEINIRGEIKRTNLNFDVSIGEVKLTLSGLSRNKAMNQLYPVLKLLKSIIKMEIPKCGVSLQALIYYGRSQEKRWDQSFEDTEDNDRIYYNFIRITG